jgi:hypothetical protein
LFKNLIRARVSTVLLINLLEIAGPFAVSACQLAAAGYGAMHSSARIAHRRGIHTRADRSITVSTRSGVAPRPADNRSRNSFDRALFGRKQLRRALKKAFARFGWNGRRLFFLPQAFAFPCNVSEK